MHHFRHARALVAALALLAAAACASPSTFGPPTVPAGAGAGARAVAAYADAPYVDVTSWPPPQFAQYVSHTGNAYYTMAFMQSYKSSKCQAAWGGQVLPSDSGARYYKNQLAALRAAGGDGILSFGGAAGLDLAMACTTATSLAAAIEAAIDAYQFTHVDFDVEGNAPYDTASVARRSAALKMVQDRYHGAVSISYTLPVLPSGLPPHVLGVVQSALKAGVTLAIVNVMAMDYGNSAAPNPSGKMGTYAIQSAQSTVKQLEKIGFPFGPNPYAAIGVTPMIGLNDVRSEVFETSDARQLVAWAAKNGVGRLSFWAQQRDKQCKGGAKTYASDTCSSIVQPAWAFGKIFAGS